MSEIAMCPVCGNRPEFVPALGEDIRRCCGFACAGKERWNQYAAAMELAMAAKKRKRAHDYVREAWKVSDEVSDLAREALEDADGEVKDAQNRVLEVFGGEAV